MIENLVDETFEELEITEINYERFKKMIYAKPSSLRWFQIDLNKIAINAKLLK